MSRANLAEIAVRSSFKKILSSGCCSLWHFNWNRAPSTLSPVASLQTGQWASAKCALFVSLRPKAMATLNLVSVNGRFERHCVVYYCHYNDSSMFHVASLREAVDSQVVAT